jgi:type IX secretion system PorP/SprF family membrane protein
MKKYCITSFIMICLLSAGQTLYAQDPHFSQYFSSPLTVNPALTGKGVADWRAATTLRSQWWGGNTAPFTTTTASVEKSYHTGNGGNSRIGIGVSMLSDASNAGLLKNNYFNGSLAYNIDLDGNGTELLGIGLGATFANRLLDAGKFEFQSQFGSMGFQRSTPSGDPASILSGHYFDLNVGIHYSKLNAKSGYGLGAAMYHAGSPQESVYNNNAYNLARRITLHGSIFFALAGNNELHLGSVADLQGNNTVITLGGIYKFKVNDETVESLNVGLYNRFGDAFYPYAAIEGKNWLLGISYDVVNPNIRNAYNSVQSMDISFSLNFGKKHSSSSKMMY